MQMANQIRNLLFCNLQLYHAIRRQDLHIWNTKISLLMIYEMNHTWTAEMKWKWRNDRRSECNLRNCVKMPEKKNSGLQWGWTRDLTIMVRCSTNWAMKPLTLGAGQLWVHMFPWKKWVLMIYEINHVWTTEMEWKWRNDRRSEINLCNCVKKPEKKNSGLQRGLNPWLRDYRCDALPTELWSHWCWEQVSCGFICSRERNEC